MKWICVRAADVGIAQVVHDVEGAKDVQDVIDAEDALGAGDVQCVKPIKRTIPIIKYFFRVFTKIIFVKSRDWVKYSFTQSRLANSITFYGLIQK
jgi:hypothetical protein